MRVTLLLKFMKLIKQQRKQKNTDPSEESLRHILADELLNIGRFNGQQRF